MGPEQGVGVGQSRPPLTAVRGGRPGEAGGRAGRAGAGSAQRRRAHPSRARPAGMTDTGVGRQGRKECRVMRRRMAVGRIRTKTEVGRITNLHTQVVIGLNI